MATTAPDHCLNPEWIVIAREARGLTQSELADELNVSQGWLSKIEAGLQEPPESLADGLAKAMDFPRELFFAKEKGSYGVGVSEFFHRKRAAAPARTMRQIHATLNLVRMNVERLMQSAELPDPNIPQHDPDEFDGEVSEIARAVRAAWRLPAGPVQDVIGAMEEAGIVIIRLPFASRHVDAISRWIPGTPPLIFVNRNLPADRERWSCCHELGHLVMHRAVSADMEVQADRFVESFLMPRVDIMPDLSAAAVGSDALLRLGALKPHWKVSIQALLMRAKHLGCIQEGRYRYLQISLSRMGYRTREPGEYDFPKDEATSLQDMLDLHLKDLEYTVDQLATHLRISTDDVRNWYERADRLRVVAGH